MQAQKQANLKMLEAVATQLGPLCQEFVFLGGCTTALFITDLASPDVRYTLDVDCIVDVLSLNEYYQVENKLIQQGFKKSLEDEVICRWHYDSIILDVMPTDENILGFGNRWYKSAIAHAIEYHLSSQTTIKVLTAAYFLATKLEALRTRGKMDFMASHDFEDIISVLDGRSAIVEEIILSEYDLKDYLKKYFSDMLDDRKFHDALPGHFIQYGNLAEDRIQLLLNKLKQLLLVS